MNAYLNTVNDRLNAETDARRELAAAAAALGEDGKILLTAASRRKGAQVINNDPRQMQRGPFDASVIIGAGGAPIAQNATAADLLAFDPAGRTGPIGLNWWPRNQAPAAANRPSFVFFIDEAEFAFDEDATLTATQFEALISGLSLFQSIALADTEVSNADPLIRDMGTIGNFDSVDGNAVSTIRRTRRAQRVRLGRTLPVWGGPGNGAVAPSGNALELRANGGGIPALPAAGVRVHVRLYGVAIQQSNNPTRLQSLYMGDGMEAAALSRILKAERTLRALGC